MAMSWEFEPQRWLGKPHTNFHREEAAQDQNHRVGHQGCADHDCNTKTVRRRSARFRSHRRWSRNQPLARHENADIQDATLPMRAAISAAATPEYRRRLFEIGEMFWTSEHVKGNASESDQCEKLYVNVVAACE